MRKCQKCAGTGLQPDGHDVEKLVGQAWGRQTAVAKEMDVSTSLVNYWIREVKVISWPRYTQLQDAVQRLRAPPSST